MLVNDIAQDPSGGRVFVKLDSPDLAGLGITMRARDDRTDPTPKSGCLTQDGECYSFNSVTMKAELAWYWSPCCTGEGG